MKKILPLILLSCLLLTACSSGINTQKDLTVKWENGVIIVDGKETALTSHKGYEATVEDSNGLSWTFYLDNAKDVTNITPNSQNILEENMEKYKGYFYYTEYLGSRMTMAKSLGNDDWIIGQCLTNNLPAATVASYGAKYMDSLLLTNQQLYVDFGSFIFGNTYDAVEVRTDKALISGVCQVSTAYHECTEPYVVVQDNKEYQLMKSSTSRYDYYTYDGFTIQIAAGMDISNYIKFK